MIRPLTSLTLLLAAGAGLYLYHVKHRTLLLDRQITATLHETEALRAKEGLLHAEWALLNQPDRLADLAARHLALKPLAPAQFVPLAELDRHLPAIVLASTAPGGEGEDAAPAASLSVPPEAPQSVSGTGAAETRPPSVAALAPPLPAVPARGATAHPAPSHKPPPGTPGGDAAGPALRGAAANAAPRRPTPPAIAPRPVVASVLRPVAASLLIDPPRPARAPQTAAIPVPAASSALGGPHVALPPPVPPPQSRADGP